MSIELNKIYNEDCLEGMKRIPVKSVDMILCDLPYGVTARNKWDFVIPFERLWEQYKRVIKENGAVVLTATQPFTTDLIQSNRKMFKYSLVWNKSQVTGFLNAKNNHLEAMKIFYCFTKSNQLITLQWLKGKEY